jgi:hypothetical protein
MRCIRSLICVHSSMFVLFIYLLSYPITIKLQALVYTVKNLGFCTRRGISWLVVRILTSQDGLCFMELVSTMELRVFEKKMFEKISGPEKVQGCYFVFGPNDATSLPARDLARRGISAYSVIGVSHFQAQCGIVFKMILYESIQLNNAFSCTTVT